MSKALARKHPNALTTRQIAEAGAQACAGKSASTQRKYAQRLKHFAEWAAAYGGAWDKRMIAAYQAALASEIDQRGKPKSVSTINGHLAAVRGMLKEAAELGMLDERIAERMASAPGVPQRGAHIGNWLSKAEAQTLVDAPDTDTLKGTRDKAILALMVTCGLRREELVSLRVGQLQQREGHWVLVDIIGKHGRVRSIKVPMGVKRAIDAWLKVSGRENSKPDAPLFVAVRKGDKLAMSLGLTSQAIYKLVSEYGAEIGKPDLRPHDLRRTASQLMRRGGAKLEQISLTLGHASIATTQRYLGTSLDLDNSAPDAVGLDLKASK